jgi:hypothetical protein
MSILTVNLKHLYQRRGLWLVYPILAIAIFGVLARPLAGPGEAGKGRYVGPVVVAFLVGFLATLLQIEVLSKPFSYCLPGHRRVLRKYVFLVAAPVSIVCSMLFLAYPGLNSWPLLLVLCSAFFANLTFCLAGAVLAEGVRGAAFVVALLPPAVLIAEGFLDLHVLLERIIIGDVFAVILVGILSGVATWLWLGRAGLARGHCAEPWMGFMDFFNKEKLVRYTYARARTVQKRFRKHPRPWVENWFLARMDKYDYTGPGRYFWGVLYSTSALAVSRWQNLPLLALVLTIMFGYIGQAVVFALIMLPAMAALGRQPPVYSTLLISGGRRRRFTTTLGLAVTDAALLCIATLIISGLSILLARFMPTFTLEGNTFGFRPIDPRVAVVPLTFLPIASTMQLIFYTRPILILTSLLLPLYMVMALGTIWREHLDFLVKPLSIVSLLVVGWGVFLLALRHICEKWCLVGQRRMH